MRAAVASTDVNPSTLTDMIGIGYDSADANVQMMHNDGSGVATKIDLGAAFPRPVANFTEWYDLTLFSPPGTTQLVGYRVINKKTGAVAEGVVTTNLPATGTFIGPHAYVSVGGVSSVVGLTMMSAVIFSER